VGEGVSLVRELDAGDLHVRFDERRLETAAQTRTEAPSLPVNSYSPRHAGAAPVVDSTRSHLAWTLRRQYGEIAQHISRKNG
jgi:hypothetical protein